MIIMVDESQADVVSGAREWVGDTGSSLMTSTDLIAPSSKVIFIGDSVTDCGRARPVGEGLFGALGDGYVRQVDAHFTLTRPQDNIRVINMGTSGNTVRDLAARWQIDVLDLSPHWLSVMIGINDVWRQFDSPLQPEIAVGLEEYEATLSDLAASVKDRVQGLVIMSPFYIENRAEDAMRARMDEYGAASQRVAIAQGAIFVDTQAAFNRLLEHRHSSSIAWDRVHPNHVGHLLLADAFLNAVSKSSPQ